MDEYAIVFAIIEELPPLWKDYKSLKYKKEEHSKSLKLISKLRKSLKFERVMRSKIKLLPRSMWWRKGRNVNIVFRMLTTGVTMSRGRTFPMSPKITRKTSVVASFATTGVTTSRTVASVKRSSKEN